MAMFHDLKEMCEYKAVAIETFWINTLKPFMVVNEKLRIYNCPNEMFSLYRILTVIRAAYEKKFPGKAFVYPSAERIQDILYDFKYCSLNREAMISFVETFADTYGVGISYIFEENKEKGKEQRHGELMVVKLAFCRIRSFFAYVMAYGELGKLIERLQEDGTGKNMDGTKGRVSLNVMT